MKRSKLAVIMSVLLAVSMFGAACSKEETTKKKSKKSKTEDVDDDDETKKTKKTKKMKKLTKKKLILRKKEELSAADVIKTEPAISDLSVIPKTTSA